MGTGLQVHWAAQRILFCQSIQHHFNDTYRCFALIRRTHINTNIFIFDWRIEIANEKKFSRSQNVEMNANRVSTRSPFGLNCFGFYCCFCMFHFRFIISNRHCETMSILITLLYIYIYMYTNIFQQHSRDNFFFFFHSGNRSGSKDVDDGGCAFQNWPIFSLESR